MSKKDFDLIVIGGGVGAKLAHSLSQQHYHCAVIEEDLLGGTCLNHGCIPSKMLIHSAELAREIDRSSLFQIHTEKIRCAFPKLVTRVTDEVTQKSLEMEEGMKENPFLTFFHQKGTFLDPHRVRVRDTILSAKHMVIATGAQPSIPAILGLKDTPFLTAKTALRLKKLPSHLIIIGGGYIAAELGFYFSALGAKVTIFARSELLSREDEDIRKEFSRIFSRYVQIEPQQVPDSVLYEEGHFTVHSKGKKYEADQLLVATGLKGSLEGLGLEKTRVTSDAKGFIQVDQYLQTAEKHIFALGDAIGSPFFRHKANFEADFLFQQQFLSKKPKPLIYPPIPHGIFSYPQVASVGASETELKKKNVSYVCGCCEYGETARGMALLPEGGFVKLLFAKETKSLLGAHIVGEDAVTLCHVLSAFLVKEARVDEMAKMIYIHPALPELIKKAAQSALEQFAKIQ